jgi:phenylacetate-CoA ligase
MFVLPKLFLNKQNIFYPTILGLKYLRYRQKRINNNYYRFNPEDELIDIVNQSILNVPYYIKKYNNSKINSFKDFLTIIDFIDKDIVMDNWEDFLLPGDHKRKIITGTTGGTSGKPLKLVLPKDRYVFELATMYSMWENIGWNGQTRAVIRNAHLKESQNFTVNPIKKEFIFDGFRTSDDYYLKIYKTLKKYRINFIHAYPSSAYQFSTFLKKQKIDTSFIRGFFCGSEGLLTEHKDLIQNQLEIKIYHWYGHSEKLILGGYCKHNDLIHIEPTYGYFELIDEEGKRINEIGKIGEIVGTTLHNPYMPLIRYRTGDYAEYAGNYCPHCKRHLHLLKKVYGRWDKNKIYRKDGSFITTTALNLHSSLYDKINGLQYIQKKKGKLVVLIIQGKDFRNEDYVLLKKHYESAFGFSDVRLGFCK